MNVNSPRSSLAFVLIRDAIMAYIFKQVQEIAYLHNRIPYTGFIDLTAEYDHITSIETSTSHGLEIALQNPNVLDASI